MEPFLIAKENVYALPILHGNLETTALVRRAFLHLNPDCVAVELPSTMEIQHLHAASRLPDISLVTGKTQDGKEIFTLCEPCDGAYEALRSALEAGAAAHCIDLDIDDYPDFRDPLPDPYAIFRIGLKKYYKSVTASGLKAHAYDHQRELHMAWKLKGLSLSHSTVLFVGGMAHIENVLTLMEKSSFPSFSPAKRGEIKVCSLTESSCRDVMQESGWISECYEKWRGQPGQELPNRQLLIFDLYKAAAERYKEATGNPFPSYHLRNIMKFIRNYALITGHLLPDLYQQLSGAKGCVDHNYAYEMWLLATDYAHLKNIDNLELLDLSVEEIWGHSKIIRFHLRSPSRKREHYHKRKKDRSGVTFEPPGPFGFCSHQPEDIVIENFGKFLQAKGSQLLCEEGARTVPFSSSLEDGIDARETLRHWHEKKLYVKVFGKPPGGAGSVVMIFDEDEDERFPWTITWHGEHEQESDMAFYATDIKNNVIGPGISRCEYGGFMMSYPPRRMWDVWIDPDYAECRSKSEVLLMAAIDYATKPVIVYVAEKPPRKNMKSIASRYGKKIVYIPIGQLSPITLNKLRSFHVLDGYGKRKIADEYIY